MKKIFILFVLLAAACGSQKPGIEAENTPVSVSAGFPPTAKPSEIPVIEVLSPAASPTAVCTEGGTLVMDEYKGFVLKKPIPILIYLPPCYKKTESYPAIYLLHGQPADQNLWKSLGVLDAADSEIAASGKDFILVMPLAPEPLFSSTDGGRNSYEDEFLNGLIPHVEETYPVSRRAIAGISRGGVWSLEIGLRHTDLFESVIALSPALSVNYARSEYKPEHLAALGKTDQKFFLIAGDGDWAKSGTISFYDQLKALGFNVDISLVSGIHEAKTWMPVLPSVLRFADIGW